MYEVFMINAIATCERKGVVKSSKKQRKSPTDLFVNGTVLYMNGKAEITSIRLAL